MSELRQQCVLIVIAVAGNHLPFFVEMPDFAELQRHPASRGLQGTERPSFVPSPLNCAMTTSPASMYSGLVIRPSEKALAQSSVHSQNLSRVFNVRLLVSVGKSPLRCVRYPDAQLQPTLGVSVCSLPTQLCRRRSCAASTYARLKVRITGAVSRRGESISVILGYCSR